MHKYNTIIIKMTNYSLLTQIPLFLLATGFYTWWLASEIPQDTFFDDNGAFVYVLVALILLILLASLTLSGFKYTASSSSLYFIIIALILPFFLFASQLSSVSRAQQNAEENDIIVPKPSGKVIGAVYVTTLMCFLGFYFNSGYQSSSYSYTTSSY